MEAPEKIWINPSMDLLKLNGVIDKDSVVYIRKDVFIEKACKYFAQYINDNSGGYDRAKLIDKDAVVSWVTEKREAALYRQHNLERIGQETYVNQMIADNLSRMLSFLDTLDVKEVQEPYVMSKTGKFITTTK